MRTGRRRSVVSIGVLALALTAVPMGAGAATAQARDCERGGGALSGVTDGLCDLVDEVGDAVDDLTGDSLAPVTDRLGKGADTVLGTVGEAAPTSKPVAPPRGDDDAGEESAGQPGEGLVSETLEETCLTVPACDEDDDRDDFDDLGEPDDPPETAPADARRPKPTPTPSASPTPRERDQDTAAAPTRGPLPPDQQPQLIDTPDPVVADPGKADADQVRVEPMWPGSFADELSGKWPGHQVVRPSAPAGDVLGTTLTAILLASAVLAARVVQRRRGREQGAGSIPFEPVQIGRAHV